jgi:hypothetical protein
MSTTPAARSAWRARRRLLASVLVLVGAFLLGSGCLIPEKFDITISIKKDGTFSAVYTGTVAQMLLRQAAVSGQLSVQDELAAKQTEGDFLHTPGFTKASYLGQGRYTIRFEKKGKLTAPVSLFDDESRLITITPLSGRTVAVRGFQVDAETVKNLEPLKMEIDGHVHLSTDGTVLQHNAAETPSFFGLLGSYAWRITSPKDPVPEATIQL